MARVALVDALPDFGSKPGGLRAAPAVALVAPAPPPPDVPALVAAAVAQAEAALAARLAAEHEDACAALQAKHQAEIARLEEANGRSAGALISQRFKEAEEQVAASAAEGAARILGSLLSDELQKRSVARLAAAIRDTFADPDAVAIEARGPQSLLEALAQALPERSGSLHLVEAEGFDLTVRVDGTLFETRLSEWSAALADILA